MEAAKLDDPGMRKDLVRIIAQYLEEQGFTAARTALLDEAGIQEAAMNQERIAVSKLATAITTGTWDEALSLCKRLRLDMAAERDKLLGLEFAIHKQWYLEQLDRREVQQAFNHLTTRMGSYDRLVSGADMRDLAFALTCQSVQDVEAFADWDIMSARARLVEQLNAAVGMRLPRHDADETVPPRRLRQLMSQAIEHQLASLRLRGVAEIKFDTLMLDMRAVVIPNALRATLSGHTGNVKSAVFDHRDPTLLISGSSDATVRTWNAATGEEMATLRGHTSRVWEVDSLPSGPCVSASADSTLRLWNPANGVCSSVIHGHESDVYTVRAHPGGDHIVSGGYDTTVRLHDVRTSAQVRLFEGHDLGVSQAMFNHFGNLIFSGSKDCQVKVWDVTSGLCVSTIAEQFAEVSGLDISPSGDQLVVATKSNTNILLDLRTNRVLKRFRGHQNSTLHFIRVRFGPAPGFLTGGSEDGRVLIWNIATGDVAQSLDGHEGAVYSTAWSDSQSLLATCSEDETVKVWEFKAGADSK
eukprot:m.211015 g.211015  ORF g.211015 m.211015 type:complete len:527 (-) comp25348_c0_seq1:30-1610(-)